MKRINTLRQRQPHDCCHNCENRDEQSFCEAVLEPLRQDYGFEGIKALHVQLNGYCRMFDESEAYREAEREAADCPELQKQIPPDVGQWVRSAGGGR